ncbi:transglycosylase SLT domain-containing protein [Methylocaldum szegediense]|jgi:soluble lytic murein transglycosylase-like protein|uniref:transglycosylase SLT domain-containing protein n=1 Tax=Methylocaldum szegediense TaxID=73780 RepID=UPI000684638B|nr:transglycosylase SLT domain-containing protein [Methylocaldum szegediense]
MGRRVWLGSALIFLSITCWAQNPLQIREIKESNGDIPKARIQGTIWEQIAEQRQLDPYILYAVALVESRRIHQSLAKPWPWALNQAGRSILPKSKEEAAAVLKVALDKGRSNIDVGLMQVNVRWHGCRVKHPEDLLDPVTNIRVAADVLAEAIGSVPDNLVLGIGRYHSWGDNNAALRYGRKVLAVAALLKTLF